LKILNRNKETPRLSQDQILSNKRKKDRRVRHRINYNLLSDGAHPVIYRCMQISILIIYFELVIGFPIASVYNCIYGSTRLPYLPTSVNISAVNSIANSTSL
jgi:hypothetical protein